jgi:16S rRNA (uracil1498-N3)-methyltransferase
VTHRFFVDEAVTDEPVLRGERAHQIATVLRLRPGEVITLVRDGDEASVRLDSVTPAEARGRVVARARSATEPAHRVTLVLPLLKGDHDERIIESVTQLGVARIVPFLSARTVIRVLSPAKRERWQRIAREAAETARRGRVPEIEPLSEWDALFDVLGAPALVAWEKERTVAMRDAAASGDVAIVIGPEGGLTEEEIAFARERGARTVSLGPRNLRSETAAVAAVTLVSAAIDAGSGDAQVPVSARGSNSSTTLPEGSSTRI